MKYDYKEKKDDYNDVLIAVILSHHRCNPLRRY